MILFDLATLTTLLRKGPAPMMGGGARAGGPLVSDGRRAGCCPNTRGVLQ